jgi:hypothetical protein
MADSEKTEERSPQNAPTQLQTQKQKLAYPECGSTRLYKDGLRYLADGKTIQRWLCRNCGYRFSENRLNCCNKFQHVQKIHTLVLNSPEALPVNAKGAVKPSRAKRPPALASWWKPWPKWKPVVKSGLRGPHRRQQTSKVKSWNSLGS